jgi:hypothetical protein
MRPLPLLTETLFALSEEWIQADRTVEQTVPPWVTEGRDRLREYIHGCIAVDYGRHHANSVVPK